MTRSLLRMLRAMQDPLRHLPLIGAWLGLRLAVDLDHLLAPRGRAELDAARGDDEDVLGLRVEDAAGSVGPRGELAGPECAAASPKCYRPAPGSTWLTTVEPWTVAYVHEVKIAVVQNNQGAILAGRHVVSVVVNAGLAVELLQRQ